MFDIIPAVHIHDNDLQLYVRGRFAHRGTHLGSRFSPAGVRNLPRKTLTVHWAAAHTSRQRKAEIRRK